jgi:heavy metal translocating P-type ATPase
MTSSRGPSLLLGLAAVGLSGGGLAMAAGSAAMGQMIWAGTTLVVLLPSCIAALQKLLARELGVDLIAILAMAGTLWMGQFLAGAIIALMMTGGVALERFAVARARRELTVLLERAPRVAHLHTDTDIETVPVDTLKLGDWIVVKPGEVIPADGILAKVSAVLDESSLTGEAGPVVVEPGAPIRSGVTNMGGPIEMRVTASAAQSTYAGILRLVAAAETSKAPFIRLADRYALYFLGATIALAGLALFIQHNPLYALTVLVVATPCPLILAAPAAIIAGISRAAKLGIIIKGGGALEALAEVTVMLFDKTGTVTAGRPRVVAVEILGEHNERDMIGLAASLEQVSAHPYAPAIMAAARERNIDLQFPSEVHEEMGVGITGLVAGRRVTVGQLAWVAPTAKPTPRLRAVERRTSVEGSGSVYVAIDGALAGAVLLRDPLRVESARTLQTLRDAGIKRIHMVTGDHPDVAELVGDSLGFDKIYTERTPEEKVEVVRMVKAEGVTAMIGDGVNDAPALAVADVGVALGARGATAAAESADIVLTHDNLGGLVLAMGIAKRTRRIVLESVLVGMGLSVLGMVAAMAGYLTPVTGAVFQEVIDVLAILNALRALGGDPLSPAPSQAVRDLARKLDAVHSALRPRVEQMASLADRLTELSPTLARQELEHVRQLLEDDLLPHEREEQRLAFPEIKRHLAPENPTGLLVSTHREIHRLARLYARLVSRLAPEGPGPEDVRDLQRALYGLHALLSLHFDQEDELYSLFER